MTALAACRAAVFDAYGTLFDVHAPAARLEKEIGRPLGELSAAWRAKQLEYTWLRALMGRHADFWQVTQDALDVAMEASGLRDDDLRLRLLDLYRSLDAYGDAVTVLERLRRSAKTTAVFSNANPGMLDDAVAAAGLGDHLDAVLSVEAAGIYKPAPRAYQVVVDQLGIPADEIAFVSSNPFDAHGAAAFGFNAVWVNRSGRPADRLPGTPRAVVEDLTQLLPLLLPEIHEDARA